MKVNAKVIHADKNLSIDIILPCKIGRMGASAKTSSDCFILLSDKLLINDPLISSKHAEIEFMEGINKVFLNDLSSTNGSFINGKKVNGKIELDLYDTIQLGSTKLIINNLELISEITSHNSVSSNALITEMTAPTSTLEMSLLSSNDAVNSNSFNVDEVNMIGSALSGNIQESSATVKNDADKCMICGKPFDHKFSILDRELHVNECIESEKSEAVARNEAKKEGTIDLGSFSCPMCGKVLTNLSEIQRQNHVDKCLKRLQKDDDTNPRPKKKQQQQQKQKRPANRDSIKESNQASTQENDKLSTSKSQAENDINNNNEVKTRKIKKQTRILSYLNEANKNSIEESSNLTGKDDEDKNLEETETEMFFKKLGIGAQTSIESLVKRIVDIEHEMTLLQKRKEHLELLVSQRMNERSLFSKVMANSTESATLSRTTKTAIELVSVTPTISIQTDAQSSANKDSMPLLDRSSKTGEESDSKDSDFISFKRKSKLISRALINSQLES